MVCGRLSLYEALEILIIPNASKIPCRDPLNEGLFRRNSECRYMNTDANTAVANSNAWCFR